LSPQPAQAPFISRDEYDFRVEIISTLRDLRGSIEALNSGLKRLEDLPDRIATLEASRDATQNANSRWQSWVQPVLMMLILAVLTVVLINGPSIAHGTPERLQDGPANQKAR
jgi:hypothetical protein